MTTETDDNRRHRWQRSRDNQTSAESSDPAEPAHPCSFSHSGTAKSPMPDGRCGCGNLPTTSCRWRTCVCDNLEAWARGVDGVASVRTWLHTTRMDNASARSRYRIEVNTWSQLCLSPRRVKVLEKVFCIKGNLRVMWPTRVRPLRHHLGKGNRHGWGRSRGFGAKKCAKVMVHGETLISTPLWGQKKIIFFGIHFRAPRGLVRPY
jgi:hypothetical protein